MRPLTRLLSPVHFLVAMSGVKRVLLTLLAVGSICLGATTACAQYSSSLRGVVSDAGGAVVPGAKVALRSNGTGFTNTATTGENGSFDFQRLPPGEYTVTV